MTAKSFLGCVILSPLEHAVDLIIKTSFWQNLREDSQCALQDCKKSVLTRGQKCRYCSNVYCLGHHLPEVHGCAQAAKEQARSATSAPKQMSQKAAVKRGQLERKFENKIKDMEKKRGNKNKNEKKIAERELLNSDYD